MPNRAHVQLEAQLAGAQVELAHAVGLMVMVIQINGIVMTKVVWLERQLFIHMIQIQVYVVEQSKL